MLGKIFGKRCDHPMADIKSAQALLNELPRNDALKSIMELTDWIESVASREDFKLTDQFAVLSLLDETAQPYARKLACEYFTLPDMHTFQGNRLCLVLGNLSAQLANAYNLLFARYGRDDAAAKLPLLAARAVRAIREQIKYIAVQYQIHDNLIWHNLAQLYQHAEQQQYLDTPVNLYHAAEPVTIRHEFGKLMAWYACGLNSLSPRSMHLSELILSQYADVVSIALNGQALCSFDLAHARAPVRIHKDAAARPSMRYVSISGMQGKLEALIVILEKNIVPEELHLGCAFTAEWVLDAAQHVLNYVVASPQRMGKRLGLEASLTVVAGCENVLVCGAGQEAGESIRMVLENASPGGFLARLSGRGGDSIRIGHVLGVKTESVPRMGVAIVRRLSRDAEGLLHVGAQVLTNHASHVTLRSGAGEDQHALWLRVEDGTATLLMQADIFSMQRSLKVFFDNKNYLLMPVKLDEAGVDYDLASFRVIEQEEE